MSNADEQLYTIKRWYEENQWSSSNQIKTTGFLLEEIDYREKQIETLLELLDKQVVNLPDYVIEIANEYGVEMENWENNQHIKKEFAND